MIPWPAEHDGEKDGHEMPNLNERQTKWMFAGTGLGCFALLLTLEIATESDDLSLLDIAIDALGILLTIGAAVGVALLTQRIQSQHEERIALIRDLETARAEGNAWRTKVQSHLAGLRTGMDVQFDEWGFTAAEREVGLLMLKGLSHKETAALRATTEATVRQQAQAIYRKANLPGKTAFSAYFLEDLFSAEDVMDGQAAAPSRGMLNELATEQGTQLG
jgi:DNA-binding CsgD family transcriptional regulator